MPLHPQIEKLIEAMDRPDRPAIYELPIEEARLAYGAMPRFMGDLGHVVGTEDRTIDGPHGQIPIRIYNPAADNSADRAGLPLVVYFHGGGFCIGDIDTHDRECHALSALAEAIVVSVDYRMGPEHAYTEDHSRPVWIDDSWAAFVWACDHTTELGGDPNRMVVAGDSAGANISAVVAQMARDDGRPLALQALIYPVTDARPQAYDTFPSYAEHADAPILERAVLDYFQSQSRPSGDHASVFMSPALTPDLSNLAPALILTAEFDPLRDDGEAYGDLLTAANGEVTVKRFDGMPHGFWSFGPNVDAALEAISDVAEAVRNT